MIEGEYKGERFRYDPEEGKLWRKWLNGNWVPVAESHRNKYYPQICSLARVKENKHLFIILAHRLAWVLVNGPIPENMFVDHINGVTTDYRLSNLRLVTPVENQQNKKIGKNNRSGVIGVCRSTKSKTWIAQIKVGDKVIKLGSFKTKKEAGMARFAAELEHGFHINHGRKPIKR